MNKLDLNFVHYAKEKYPEFFSGKRILEIGALDVNGNVRGPFDDCAFVGIDWAKGKNVDIVVPAKETEFDTEEFDMILSFNHLEHDPDWTESLGHNFSALKRGGLIMLRWATRASGAHGPEFDPHGEQGYYPKDMEEVLDFLLESHMKPLYQSKDRNPAIGVMANIIAEKP